MDVLFTGSYGNDIYNASRFELELMNDFKNHTIWTNVQVDLQAIPNAIIFPDKDILEVMRTINVLNDMERSMYSKPREGSNIMDHDRNAFTNHVIFFDE